MLAPLLVITGTALAALPLTGSEWLPILQEDGHLTDPAEESESIAHLDIVGDSEHPAGHWSMDTSTVYLRLRLAASPDELGLSPFMCSFYACQWSVLVNTDDDLAGFDRALVLSNGAASLQIRSGAVETGWTSDTSTVLFEETDPIGTARVRAISADSSIGGSGDSFVELAVPRVWLDLSDSEATAQVALATGIGLPGDGMSVDLASPDEAEDLALAWSLPIGLDSDDDGLLLSEELELGSDPQDADTDDDGLDDREERDLGTSPTLPDTDSDGLTDLEERDTYATNPTLDDTDGDGLSDGDEVLTYGTDPLDPLDPDPAIDDDCDGLSDEVDPFIDGESDTDGDGLPNEAEWECESDPCVANLDIDGDGISNTDELAYETDPCDASDPDVSIDADCDGIADYADEVIEAENEDVDGDGILNEDEASCGGDPCVAEADHDGDGLSTTDELELFGYNPCDTNYHDTSIDEDCDGTPDYRDEIIGLDPLADNDGDGIANGQETDECETDPCTADTDPDRDGISNEHEATCGTNPCSPDSDADGQWDGDEMSETECTDEDGNGTVDALEATEAASTDPTRPENGSYGFSGGAFTGGGCASTSGHASLWLAALGLLLATGRRRPLITGLALVALTTPKQAQAQSIDADRFKPAPVNHAFTRLVDPVRTPATWTAAAWFHHASRPLIYRYDDPAQEPLNLVKSLWSITPQAGFQKHLWMADVTLPIHAYVTSDDAPQLARPGDARISGTRVLRDRTQHPWGLAIMVSTSLPTGDETVWLGRSGPRTGASAHISAGSEALFGASVGLEGAPREELPGITLGPSIQWTAGASVPIAESHRFSVEVDADHSLPSLLKNGANAVEAAGHWHWSLAEQWSSTLGFGGALTRGIGSPQYRVAAGIRYAPPTPVARQPERRASPAPPAPPAPTVATDRLIQVMVTNTKGHPLVAHIETRRNEPSVGTTNEDGVTMLSLPLEQSTIRIKAEGYAPVERSLAPPSAAADVIRVELLPRRVHIGEARLRIDDKVFFDTGEDSIDPASNGLLDEVALVLMDNPTLKHIEVQGHTDDKGSDEDNLQLSLERARAVVNYLVAACVDTGRLSARGMGESQPLQEGASPEARALNRRVEFHIRTSQP